MLRKFSRFFLLAVLLTACSPEAAPDTSGPTTLTGPALTSSPPQIGQSAAPPSPASGPKLGLTYQSADGNRFVSGKIDLRHTTPLDIPLQGKPVWVVSAQYLEGSLWVAALESGEIEAFTILDGEVSRFSIAPATLPPGMPPVLVTDGKEAYLANLGAANESSLTHPLPLPDFGISVHILADGGISVQGTQSMLFNQQALLDTRIVSDGSNFIVLTAPTTAYDHGVLGDAVEASEISIYATQPQPMLANSFKILGGRVIEGILPILADLNGDGIREIIVTESDLSNGAQISVYSQDGKKIASSAAIGLPYRWRHQIAAAPFGPNGEIELADVLTPHLGRRIEFFQMDGSALKVAAWVDGFTSHLIGSRNLDMSLAGDFDGDGIVELIVISPSLTSLAAVQRTMDGAVIDFEIDLEQELATNLSAVAFENGTIGLGAGLNGNTLRVWLE